MKSVHLGLLFLTLLAAAGAASAFVLLGRGEAGTTSSPIDPRAPTSAASRGEAPLGSSTDGRSVQDASTAWQREVSQELQEIKAELAAMRRAVEGGGGRASLAESGTDAHRSPDDEWAARVHEAEERLLIESISRQRENTRLMLDQEATTAADTDATTDVREAAGTAVEKLRNALKAIDRVRTSEQLANWCRDYSIEPLR